ncbi:NACHT domain-containing protein [Actinoplanes solisilvae]|uniref:NACHT domain-containing protein n=1 Tax=Actinoplanes solisilvae TaxID=2486853 RepID=UPI000FD79C08|nr:hypothetical protein [Actinoplanes solisilvae]
MSRGVSYADAVRLLGGSGRAVAAVDKLSGGLLLSASATGAGFALNLFDAAGYFARFSGELVAGVRERLDGVRRFDRAERLAAAHSVVVMAAFFEVLSEASLPFDVADLELRREDQVRLATGASPSGARVADLGRALLRSSVPCPAAERPYEITLAAVDGFYIELSGELNRYFEGLAVWDRLDETGRRHTVAALAELPAAAVRRDEVLFRRLAVEVPEVGFWANLTDHRATRAEVRHVSESLAVLGRDLAALAIGAEPGERCRAIARAHRAVLNRPVLNPGEAPAGALIPSLEQLYVDPRFRVSYSADAEDLATEQCWAREQPRDDLPSFLAGYLTGLGASEAPLLVLGQPGSGKSALSRVLAARLPAADFLAVVVPLREVPADADLQTQIEDAIRASTGESVTWPELVRGAGDAMPVVILDGFDELLQASGLTHSDYLEKVAAFQRREAELRRRTAVIVTSRVTVAARARSVGGMVAVRLEPFDDGRIRRWLEIWNGLNPAPAPLEADAVLRHRSLAAQPLLLLMLALYDADDDGALRRRAGAFGESELYESLLTSFARREVRKSGGDAAAVEEELTRLSTVAFAIFNRNRQWTTQAELDADLPALLDGDEDVAVVSRFYFVHQSQAVRDGKRLRTYEFLHATFGEYLVARLVRRELANLVSDDLLFALLSFAALTSRATVVRFLRDGLADLPAADASRLRERLLTIFHRALFERPSPAYAGYRPSDVTVTGRHAAWSANLVLLIVLVGGPVTAKELFPAASDGVAWWRQTGLLWRGQLATEGWNGLVHSLQVSREWDGDRRVLWIGLADDGPVPPIDLDWAYPRVAATADRDGGLAKWRHYGFEDMRRHSYFLCDRVDDTAMHVAEAFGGSLEPAVGTLHALPGGPVVSPARALIEVLTSPDEELIPAYDRCLSIAAHGFLDSGEADATALTQFRAALRRLLTADRDRLPPDWHEAALARL